MFTLNCKGRLLTIERPLVMGIINITPDSFYAGSRVQAGDRLLREVEQMILEGADLIDIGAQSSRPGSTPVEADDELRRLIDPLSRVAERFPDLLLSVDTYYARVAVEAVSAGASMINDISGAKLDPDMAETAGRLNVPYILTHMRGTPATMQQFTDYPDLLGTVLDYFTERSAVMRAAGVRDLILDPGFGFAKTISQNFELLRKLRSLQIFGLPVLAGLSRKGTIYKTLEIDPSEALNGTTVLHTIALMNGASILRVHDVQEAVETVKLVAAYGT